MKTRSGFVSNSSSSSFIVRVPCETDTKIRLHDSDEMLTSEDLSKVQDYGFRPTTVYQASQLEAGCETNEWYEGEKRAIAENTRQLGYQVSCNEDEVIEFLVRNNIPFTGSTHYGHQSVFFRRDSKELIRVENSGLIFEMYCHSPDSPVSIHLTESMLKGPALVREPISGILGSTDD